jgi:hypothetical protein
MTGADKTDHMEAPEVVRLAGCATPTSEEVTALENTEVKRAQIERLEKEMTVWREGRETALER